MLKRIAIVNSPIAVAQLRSSRPALSHCGAYSSFEGIIRNVNDGRAVTHLEYECYEALALSELNRIVDQATVQYGLGFIEVSHRVGNLKIGDVAVFIQALSPHRREAIAAVEQVINQLKVQVPIWKKEYYQDGSHQWTKCHHHHHEGM